MNEKLTNILLNISYYNNKSIRYNAYVYYNHSLYWETLSPNSSNKISEALSNQITKDYFFRPTKTRNEKSFKSSNRIWLGLVNYKPERKTTGN